MSTFIKDKRTIRMDPISHINIVYHSANRQEARHIASFAESNHVGAAMYELDNPPSGMSDINGHIVLSGHRTLMLVSDNLLKSEVCMRLSLALVNDLQQRDMLLPVVTMGRYIRENDQAHYSTPTSFERVSQVILYMNYWQDAYLEMRKSRRLITPDQEERYNNQLTVVRQISADIGELLRLLRAMTYVRFEELTHDNFIVLSRYLDLHMPNSGTSYETVATETAANSLSASEPVKDSANMVETMTEEPAVVEKSEPVAHEPNVEEEISEPILEVANTVEEKSNVGFVYIDDLINGSMTASNGNGNGSISLSELSGENGVTTIDDIVKEVVAESHLENVESTVLPELEEVVEGIAEPKAEVVLPEPEIIEAVVEPIVEVAAIAAPPTIEAATEVIDEIAPEEPAESAVITESAKIEVSSFITQAMLRAQAQAHIDLAQRFHEAGEQIRANEHYHCAVAIDPELENPLFEERFALTPTPIVVVEPEPELPKYPEDNEKVVFITGATSGIGKATAEKFASEGYRLVLTGRRAERLDALQEQLKTAYNSKIQLLNFDVRSVSDAQAAIESLGEEFKHVDILLNNAGGAKGLAPIHEGNIEHWETMIDANLKGLLYITRAIAPHMVASKHGHIINIASVAGKNPYPNGNVYCATKAAVDMLTRGMRQDLYQHNVRVSQVSPGHVEETEFALARFDGDTEKAKIYNDFQPLRAADVADVIFYIATRPAHVNIDDVVMYATQQAGPTMIDRSGRP